jgi:hypothetical protein
MRMFLPSPPREACLVRCTDSKFSGFPARIKDLTAVFSFVFCHEYHVDRVTLCGCVRRGALALDEKMRPLDR